ncbi:F-box/FBD/LRR-repeat protein At3g26920-like [Vicia villosa]|uniref:F-box/FBD/LRR-repeat protein At3g26920-like n=1 Tax=Vicia villosa TaxID=3911 RepID=UPI00273CDEA1|nr:F-box/FBD/LRR-repeat protein At3g26920-like [Vicia villosa]
MFYNLTQMELVFNVQERWGAKWEWILKILQQSPNLQHLIIHEKRENENGINDKKWEDPKIVPECVLSRLRTCLLRSCRGTKSEVKFAEYVMRNSKVLVTMTIHCFAFIGINKMDEILQKLSVCPKSCKLIFD